MARSELLRRFARARPLLDAEREFLARFFAPSLDLDAIMVGRSIGRRCWSPHGAKISLTSQCFENGDARESIDLASPRSAATFAHEAAHVWQRQQGRWVTLRGIPLQAAYILRLSDPYLYAHSNDPQAMLERFVAGNIEQQARMVEHYVHASLTGADITPYQQVAELLTLAEPGLLAPQR